jgi:hypothetical protein
MALKELLHTMEGCWLDMLRPFLLWELTVAAVIRKCIGEAGSALLLQRRSTIIVLLDITNGEFKKMLKFTKIFPYSPRLRRSH